jgi:putative RNA 2'-phosphotransferase
MQQCHDMDADRRVLGDKHPNGQSPADCPLWVNRMKHSHAVDKLAKMIVYIIGRHPDAFGLLPDVHGYVKTRDLIKVMGEEPGWRHVRLSHVREVLYTSRSPVIEIKDNLIRAVDRSHLHKPVIPDVLPTLLYYPMRQRAYPAVLAKGIQTGVSGTRVILTGDMALARRLGRRVDSAPVILTVNTNLAIEKGSAIWRFGKHLFLFDRLPIGSFSGPPLPKKPPEPKKAGDPGPPDMPKTPGSFFLDPTIDPTARHRSQKGSRQHKNEWKRARKQKSRNKAFP